MPWKKGQSGNPSGRPKQEAELVRQARQLGPKCIETLAALLDHNDPKVRADAAKTLLDRGYGRPQSETKITGNLHHHADVRVMHLEAVRELSRKATKATTEEAQVIEHEESLTPQLQTDEWRDRAKTAYAERQRGNWK